MEETRSFDTIAVHAGEDRHNDSGAICLPIHQSSTYLFEGAKGDDHGIRYLRLHNTPNHLALQEKLALLEGAEDALVTGSGMAAITTAVLATLRSGDHLLVQAGCYGGAHRFFAEHLPPLGIAVDFVPMEDERPGAGLPDLSRFVRPNTRAIYVETVSNPLLSVIDLEGVARFAKGRGLVSMIDSTFATPVNARPIEWGFDLVLHSASKALNGHSDLVAGVIAGSKERIGKIAPWLHHLGATLDPHACFLLNRGLKTLGLRARHQNESALRVARFLAAHPRVERVFYPWLEGHPSHARARKLLRGGGSVLSFELRDDARGERAEALVRAVRIPKSAPSIGGVEALITRPATTSHSWIGPEARARFGIRDSLVRYSVGIEDPADLIADLTRALG